MNRDDDGSLPDSFVRARAEGRYETASPDHTGPAEPDYTIVPVDSGYQPGDER